MAFNDANNLMEPFGQLNIEATSDNSAENTRHFRYCSRCNRPTYGHKKPTGENCTLNILNPEELNDYMDKLRQMTEFYC